MIMLLTLIHSFLTSMGCHYSCMLQRTGLVKVRRVLRAIRKHFPQPPEDVLVGNAIDKFLDDLNLCEDKLSDEAGSDGFLETITKVILPDDRRVKQQKSSSVGRYITSLLFSSECKSLFSPLMVRFRDHELSVIEYLQL